MAIDDPNSEVIAGMTKGLLTYTEEKIKSLAQGLMNRELAFIEDRSTIELVRDQRHSTEWTLLSDYIKDRNLRVIAQMGLALRNLEDSTSDVISLRNKIVKVYGVPGLHIAEAVQNGVLTTFISVDSPSSQSPTELTKKIEKMLKDVDKYIVFIRSDDSVPQKVKEIETRIYADVPENLILYGCKDGAIRKTRSIVTKINSLIKGYKFTSSQDDLKIIVVIRKDDGTAKSLNKTLA